MRFRDFGRQLIHIFVGTLVLFLLIINLLTPLHLFIIIVISAILSLLSRKFHIPVLYWFIDNFDHEKDKKKFPGRAFISFFVGILLSVKLFEPSLAYAAIMVMTIGDSVSNMIGYNLGKIKNPLNGHKALEGNIAGALVGFFGASFFIPPLLAAAGSFGAMLIEAIQIRMNEAIVDDNIIVPLTFGAIVMIMRSLI
ncbi:hypothetical protein KY320_00615 [Candidatus Woesearchaeota archaeon]|nr:hypothetical protein [Candidatus Woesearchaeota archaeon]